MKQNPGNVSTGRDEQFVEAMIEIFRQGKRKRPSAVIESGTFHGTGTTAAIIEAIKACHKRPHLVVEMFTIEPDSNNYAIAKKNLEPFKWCRVIHGSSLDIETAEDFIQNDEMLLYPEAYPDVYVDAADPIPFYLSEVRGQLFGGKSTGAENVFAALLPELERRTCLWVLDSAGGIGWLEFQTVLDMMGDSRRFYVWLHDIAHVKHIRSYEWIKERSDVWTIIDEKLGEWCLALHDPNKESE